MYEYNLRTAPTTWLGFKNTQILAVSVSNSVEGVIIEGPVERGGGGGCNDTEFQGSWHAAAGLCDLEKKREISKCNSLLYLQQSLKIEDLDLKTRQCNRTAFQLATTTRGGGIKRRRAQVLPKLPNPYRMSVRPLFYYTTSINSWCHGTACRRTVSILIF